MILLLSCVCVAAHFNKVYSILFHSILLPSRKTSPLLLPRPFTQRHGIIYLFVLLCSASLHFSTGELRGGCLCVRGRQERREGGPPSASFIHRLYTTPSACLITWPCLVILVSRHRRRRASPAATAAPCCDVSSYGGAALHLTLSPPFRSWRSAIGSLRPSGDEPEPLHKQLHV